MDIQTADIAVLHSGAVRPLYQTEWFGIALREAGPLSSSELPSATFYENFFRLLWSRYDSYESLPADWRAKKVELASLVMRLLPRRAAVLSIGSGLGYVEKLLGAGGLVVRGVEPSDAASRLVDFQVDRGYFPAVPADRPPVDAILLLVIDYAFDERQWIELLRHTASYPASQVLIVSCSIYKTRALPRQLARALLDRLTGKLRQRWGFQRTAEELERSCHEAGLQITDSGSLPDKSMWLLCTSDAGRTRDTRPPS